MRLLTYFAVTLALAVSIGWGLAAPGQAHPGDRPAPHAAPALPVAAGAPRSAFASLAARWHGGPLPALVAAAGRGFLGRPYDAHTLDAYPAGLAVEPLVARLDAFDCVTFVETSLAIARAVALGRPDEAGFQQELERLRYRDGQRGGYGTRMHYFSEWIANNARRGLVQDLTPALGGQIDARPIRFMSQHRGAYARLADARAYAGVLAAEAGLDRRPRRVIPKARLAGVLDRLQTGDILAIATNLAGLDVVHVGLAWRAADGQLHLLHAPAPGQRVTISRLPLDRYMAGFAAHAGLMVARPLAPTGPSSASAARSR